MVRVPVFFSSWGSAWAYTDYLLANVYTVRTADLSFTEIYFLLFASL